MTVLLKDRGLVLTKKNSIKDDKLIIIFSETFGKISVFAKNIKSITSKRLSHLETGNYINFIYSNKYNLLHETELIYGYSKIKENQSKIDVLYQILFILNQILPENQKEDEIYTETLLFLKNLNNKQLKKEDITNYLKNILLQGGYISDTEIDLKDFDPIKFLEKLTSKKMVITALGF